jgi:hypothetical protein
MTSVFACTRISIFKQPDTVIASHDFAISRPDMPEVCQKFPHPSQPEGAGNTGRSMHPQPRVRNKTKHTSKSPQVRRNDPAFPAQWLYDLFRALSGDRAFLSPSPRNAKHCRELTPASRRQDHAALSSADRRIRHVRLLRPSPPAPNVRDDRDTPLLGRARDARKLLLICPTSQANLLRHNGTTGKSLGQREMLSRTNQALMFSRREGSSRQSGGNGPSACCAIAPLSPDKQTFGERVEIDAIDPFSDSTIRSIHLIQIKKHSGM